MPRRRDDDWDDDDDRPRRRRRRDDFDDDRPPPRKEKSSTGLIVGILIGVFVLLCGGVGGVGYLIYVRGKRAVNDAVQTLNDSQDVEKSRQNLSQIGRGI